MEYEVDPADFQRYLDFKGARGYGAINEASYGDNETGNNKPLIPSNKQRRDD